MAIDPRVRLRSLHAADGTGSDDRSGADGEPGLFSEPLIPLEGQASFARIASNVAPRSSDSAMSVRRGTALTHPVRGPRKIGPIVTGATTVVGANAAAVPVMSLGAVSVTTPAATQPRTSNTTQVALGADVATQRYGVTGSGLKIGIISDSFDTNGGAAADVAARSLPATVTVLHDAASRGSDEGRALVEIANTIAPGAQFYFYNSGGNTTDFGTAVTALQAAGCTVIIDDVSVDGETFYQVGSPLDNAIAAAVAKGSNYFTASGNSGNDFYENGFTPVTATIAGIGPVTANDFGGGSPYLNITIPAGMSVRAVLGWAQPSFSYSGGGGAQNSLALYLLDSAGALVASVANDNVGGDAVQPSLTFTNSTANTNFRAVILQNGGTVPAGQLFKVVLDTGGTLSDPNANRGSGTLLGHQFAPGINVLAAVNATSTPAFGGSATIEAFSSVGPGEILYDQTGNPFPTPVQPSKPQFAAPDGTATNSSNGAGGVGFTPFFGTSAAAPAAGAVAALVLQVNGGLSTAQLTSILTQSAIPASSTNGFNGAGLIQARAAVEIGAADAGTRWTVPDGGDWNAAGNWSSNAVPTTAQAVSIDDDLGAYAGNVTVTVGSGGEVAGSIAIAAPLGSSATLVVAVGGNLTIGGSSAANPTANDCLVSDNGALRVSGGTLGVAGSLNVNNGNVSIASGAATAADYAQNAGQAVVGGSTVASLTINSTGFSETGGTVMIAALGTLATTSLAVSSASFAVSAGTAVVTISGSANVISNAVFSNAGIFQDAGSATFTTSTATQTGRFSAAAVAFRRSTLIDSGSIAVVGDLSFDDTSATVSSTGTITAGTLNIGGTLAGLAVTLIDAGAVKVTGNFDKGTSGSGGNVRVQSGGTFSIGGSFADDTITFGGDGLLAFTSTDTSVLANSLNGTISGLAANNGAIDFTGLSYASGDSLHYFSDNGQVLITDTGSNTVANVFLDTATNYSNLLRLQSDGPANHVEVVVICFAAGTRIQTDRGEVAVQSLRPGDVAITHPHSRHVRGRIIWIGQRASTSPRTRTRSASGRCASRRGH